MISDNVGDYLFIRKSDNLIYFGTKINNIYLLQPYSFSLIDTKLNDEPLRKKLKKSENNNNL